MNINFADPSFRRSIDRAFSPVATPSGARELLKVDVREINQETREKIREIVANARESDPDPSARSLLISTEAALGKTHTVVSEILRISDEGVPLFPVVVQLTANVPLEQVDRWLAMSIFSGLESKDFALRTGLTPIKELADKLAALANWNGYQQFYEATNAEEIDHEHLGNEALNLGIRVCNAIENAGRTPPDAEFLAALFLTTFRVSADARRWLLGSTDRIQIGNLVLDGGLMGGSGNNMKNLGLVVGAVGGVVLLAIDQIENAVVMGSIDLVEKIFTCAIGVIENNPTYALAISTYADFFEKLKNETQQSHILDRLSKGIVSAVKLKAPTKEQIRKSVDIRAARLLELTDSPADASFSYQIASEEFIELHAGKPLRVIFNELRNSLRNEVVDSDKKTSEDYDKLWADAKDESMLHVTNLLPIDRANDLRVIAEKLVDEIDQLSKVQATIGNVQKRYCSQYVDVSFSSGGDNRVVERWKIGLIDEANQQGHFRNQLDEFLAHSTEAHPAFVRLSNIPGVIDGILTEKVQNLTANIANNQAGTAILKLRDAGGRAIQMPNEEWIRLRMAKEFIETHSGKPGFDEWRRTRQFIFSEAGINGLKELLRPTWLTDRPLPPSIFKKLQTKQPGNPGINPTNPIADDLRGTASILIGEAMDDNSERICWNLNQELVEKLPNFGLIVSGDSGQGKTQIIRPLIVEATRLGCPALIFDFKNDYSDEFAEKHEFTVIDLRNGVPFNPFRPPQTGPSGCQPMQHIYEVAGVMDGALGLGAMQSALFRDSMAACFDDLGVDVHDWHKPEAIQCPGMAMVLEKIKQGGGATAATLVNRLGMLAGLNLLPSDETAQMQFSELLDRKVVLLFSNLPGNDRLKSALVELFLIQASGHMLKGEQPRALRRLFVFDEAWRASQSESLARIAREGRAFGVGIVAGTQFSDDLPANLTGNLATKLHFFNSDAQRRRKIVNSVFGTVTTHEARHMLDSLGDLKPHEAVVINQHFSPYLRFRTVPYFERTY